MEERLSKALVQIGKHGDNPAFRERLEDTLETYAGTRAAAAQITTSLLTVGAGALAVKQVTPGVMSLGPALAAALTQNAAITATLTAASTSCRLEGASSR